MFCPLVRYSIFPGENGRPGSYWNMEVALRLPDLAGSTRNQQEPVNTGSRTRLPHFYIEFLAFFCGFRPQIVSFLWVFSESSRNTAPGITVLGL